MGWIIYAGVVLLVSILIGMHLGRFREAYTEMTGMMAGMTMGMLNGFLLGYCAAAVTNSMFWGNLFGILLGLTLGAYFGRAGGLMGIMDGAMGGVMGGSMGAMLAAMLAFPSYALFWTAILLGLVYVAGMAALIVLIERSAPGHAALHRLAPYFTRAMAAEAEETAAKSASRNPQIEDYYAFLGVPRTCDENAISDAYLAKLAVADEADVQRADRALAILTDPVRRQAYDGKLAASGRGDCCPPPKAKKIVVASAPTAVVESKATVAVSSKQTAPTKTTQANTQTKQLPPKPTQPSKNGANRAQTQTHKQPVPQRHPRSRAVQKKSGIGRGPVIGGLAVLILAGVFLSWQMGQAMGVQSQTGSGLTATTANGLQLPPEFVSKLEAGAVAAPVATDGKQTLDLVINGDTMSYRPNTIRVKQGVPVHFNVSTEGRDPG